MRHSRRGADAPALEAVEPIVPSAPTEPLPESDVPIPSHFRLPYGVRGGACRKPGGARPELFRSAIRRGHGHPGTFYDSRPGGGQPGGGDFGRLHLVRPGQSSRAAHPADPLLALAESGFLCEPDGKPLRAPRPEVTLGGEVCPGVKHRWAAARRHAEAFSGPVRLVRPRWCGALDGRGDCPGRGISLPARLAKRLAPGLRADGRAGPSHRFPRLDCAPMGPAPAVLSTAGA